jgi:hypothetical protein
LLSNIKKITKIGWDYKCYFVCIKKLDSHVVSDFDKRVANNFNRNDQLPDVVNVIVIVDKDVQISSQFVYFNTSMVEMFTSQCDIRRNKLAITTFDLKN